MAFGSGSSLATDCSTKRRGSPASLQLLRAGRASCLHQVSSRKPTTQPRRPSARRINRSRRLFFFGLPTRVFAELPGSLVQQLPQGLGLLGIEGPMDGVRMLRAWLKRFREPLLVEGMDGVARRLRIAAQLVSDLVGVFAPLAEI